MLLAALVLVPGGVSLLVARLRSPRARAGLLIATAGAHLLATGWLWTVAAASAFQGWLAVDPLGLVVLTTVSLLFFAAALSSVAFLRDRPARGAVFVACLLAFLAAATLVALSQHLALLWIGMEAMTLALAPLVYHRRDRRSLEAAWKYLVLSSVGIGLALFGTFFLASAQSEGRPLLVDDLTRYAHSLDPALLRTAFVFLLVGYGTKMGMAPLHSWKPDTYGEAPSQVGGLMAGGLTTCAFLGLARIVGVAVAAGQQRFIQVPLIGLGLVSLVVSAAFIIGQSDLKRLLAYSSVEHMGILTLGLGLGGAASYGAVLHVLNNGLTKGLMFLAAGNVVLAYGTAQADAIRGALRRLPVSGGLLLVGLFAVTGSPPFGLFVSEFTILGAAVRQGHPWLAVITAFFLAVIFVGVAGMLLEMVYGQPAEPAPPRATESALAVAGPIALAAIVLLLGLYLPGPLHTALARAAAGLGGRAP